MCEFSVKALLKCNVSKLIVKRFDKINIPIRIGLDIQQYSIYLVEIGILPDIFACWIIEQGMPDIRPNSSSCLISGNADKMPDFEV